MIIDMLDTVLEVGGVMVFPDFVYGDKQKPASELKETVAIQGNQINTISLPARVDDPE